ncbi:MAG: multidrug efflux RND transporter permease subunit [Casimicrobium sp.]
MISRFFIDRPIFATVISVVISLAGLAAIGKLPLAQYPNLTPPTVSVSAAFPGASPETVASAVAEPLEQKINGVDGMKYMSSTSSANGGMSLNITFAVGTDIDKAASEVQNRVNLATPDMPQVVRDGGVTVSKGGSDPLMYLALQSQDDRYDDLYISNYASKNVLDELKRIPGVSKAELLGAEYAARIWLKPDRMAQLRISSSDIKAAIREQNVQASVGSVGAPPYARPIELTLPITARGRLTDTRELGEVILSTRANGAAIRLKDVARIELGAQSYDVKARLNGKSAALIVVTQTPGANAVKLAKSVRERMAALSQQFPAGIVYSVPYDTTISVKASIDEVIQTLGEAMLLVFVVVFVFLQSWRATLIPLLAVPVSLLGALGGLYLLGYSINTITLFAMVLAIGIVVDDAIVVVENVERIMHETGLDAKEASRQAMDEVTGPVVAIVLVLCSVFIPVAMLDGVTGQIYKQFAITIAISVVVSGWVALTLTPALTAILLRPTSGHRGRVFTVFNRVFGRLTDRYTAGTASLAKRTVVGFSLYVLMVFAVVGLNKVTPSSFIPSEDSGVFIGFGILPDGASLSRTEEVTKKVEDIVRRNPAVKDMISINGQGPGGVTPSQATYFIALKDWGERKTPALKADATIDSLRAQFSSILEAQVIAFNPPPIPGLGGSKTGGFDLKIQNKGSGGMAALEAASTAFAEKAISRPELAGVSPQISANAPQVSIDIDRDKVKAFGVSLSDFYDSLNVHFGSSRVGDLDQFGKTIPVTMQAESNFRERPEDIGRAFVRTTSADGKQRMISVSSLARVSNSSGPSSVERYNGYVSASISGSPAPGYSSGQAMDAMEAVARETLPSDMGYQWDSASQEGKESGSSAVIAFGAGLVMIFLVLASQYERWSLPVGVIMAVPFGLLGAFLAIWMAGLNNDIYFQIGMVTLIALSAKNAILIVEFAVMERALGKSPFDAAVEAARLRFRPIVMTSLAFALGVVPLLLSSGAGAASRHSIGTGVFGGMILGTVLTVFFIPMIYVAIETLTTRQRRITQPPGAKIGVGGIQP